MQTSIATLEQSEEERHEDFMEKIQTELKEIKQQHEEYKIRNEAEMERCRIIIAVANAELAAINKYNQELELEAEKAAAEEKMAETRTGAPQVDL